MPGLQDRIEGWYTFDNGSLDQLRPLFVAPNAEEASTETLGQERCCHAHGTLRLIDLLERFD